MHPHPKHPQHKPFPSPQLKCVKSAQKPNPSDASPYLDKKDENKIKQVVISFLYYGQLVDPKYPMDLSILSIQQLKLTEIKIKEL